MNLAAKFSPYFMIALCGGSVTAMSDSSKGISCQLEQLGVPKKTILQSAVGTQEIQLDVPGHAVSVTYIQGDTFEPQDFLSFKIDGNEFSVYGSAELNSKIAGLHRITLKDKTDIQCFVSL